MTVTNFQSMVRGIWEDHDDTTGVIGLRFDNRLLPVGHRCERSRHNTGREDEREFPEYGTPEFWNMRVLDGTSAWRIDKHSGFYGWFNKPWQRYMLDREAQACYMQNHAYIITGERTVNEDETLDDYEIVIENAVIVRQLF